MRGFGLVLVTLLLAPLAVLAAPSPTINTPSRIEDRQGRCRVVTPTPCRYISPPPTEEETAARHKLFAEAFLVQRNLSEAFKYIDNVYTNHNPAATQEGPREALNILGPIWCSLSIQVLRVCFRGDMGWVNYNSGGFGQVIDRFRWKEGCITEHWDSGERWPATCTPITLGT